MREHHPIKLEEKDGNFYGAGPIAEDGKKLLVRFAEDGTAKAAIQDVEGKVTHLVCDSPVPVEGGSADCRIGTNKGSLFVYRDRTGSSWRDYMMFSPHVNSQRPEDAQALFAAG